MRERRSNSVPSCRTGLITKNITRRMTHSLYLTLLTAGTSLGLVVLMPLEAAHAGGFFVQEASTSGAGAAYAGQAATARDSSVIFHNPAGIALLDEAQVNAGIHFLYSHSELEDQGSTVAGFPLGSAPGPLSPYNAFTDDGGNP